MFSTMRRIISRSSGPSTRLIGTDRIRCTTAPARPASRPTSAPSAGEIGVSCICCCRYAATNPPPTTHRQQHVLPTAMMGSADSTPMTSPPARTGWALIVVFTAKVRDQIFALEIPQRVLQLHQLDEQIVFGIEIRRVHRRLEVERQPLLDAAHAGALGQVEEQRDVQDDRRRQDAVAAQEVDLELHRV